MTATRALAVAVLAVLAVTGCGATVTGRSAVAPDQSAAPAAPQQPDPNVPRVAHPRDARNIAACDLLTPAQLDVFGADPLSAKSSEQNSGLRCEWRTRDNVGTLEAVVAAELGSNGFISGLASLYNQRDTYAVFEPGDLDGFPVVHADRVKGSTECTIYFGSSDDQLLYTAAGFVAGRHQGCDVARRMASAVLSNLPPLK